MKVRNGYVSNSSTSSFVIIGKEISEQEYSSIYDQYGSNSSIISIDDGSTDLQYFVGEFINENDKINTRLLNLSEKVLDKISKNMPGYIIDANELRIFSGTMWC